MVRPICEQTYKPGGGKADRPAGRGDTEPRQLKEAGQLGDR
jgi:hypothetical protein